MQIDSLNWFFSSSAQAIAALVAFLLAGLALVQTMMDNAQQRDDSLVEIHANLQILYYQTFKRLIIGTGLAVGFSLAMLIVNANPSPWKFLGAILVGFLNIVVIAVAIGFVLEIVNPKKYQVNAQKIMGEDRKRLNLPEPSVAEKEFFAEFVKLETSIRGLLKQKRLYVPSQDVPKMFVSFRQMTDLLYQHELISSSLYEELLKINRYRNLVFHGQAHETDKEMVDRIKAASTQVLDISPKRISSKKTTSR
jgi:hypothetical protein